MARWRRILACLCAAVLTVALLAGDNRAMADNVEIYIVAENDQIIVDLPLEAMPAWIGGVMYVPYHAFDWTYTGVNLGVSYGQDRTGTEYTFTLYSLNGALVFDLNGGTCVEQSTGEDMGMKAVLRNGRVFVPLAGVCRYFGLNYSYTPTNYGTLIRITNGQEELTTSRFVESAVNQMRVRYNEYLKAMGTTSSPKPTSTADSGAVTTPDATPSSGEPDQRQLTVALAFQCTGTGAEKLLDALDGAEAKGVLFFRPEVLADNEQAIRRAVGSGYTVGLSVPAGNGEQALSALEEGSRWLEENLCLRTHLALLEEGDKGAVKAAEEAGWACWTGDLDARDDGRSQSIQRSALLNELEGERGTVRVLMDDSANGAGMLEQALVRMRQAGYQFRLLVETDF